MKRLRLTLFSAIITALSLTAPAVAQNKADAGERIDRARSLFKQGLDALASRKYEAARTHLLEAFKLSPSFDVAGALGQAELELGRYRDAAEHLEHSLRNFAPSESLQVRKRVTDGLEAAKKRVGIVRLSVTPEGTEVRVDGVLIGSAPLAPQIFVEPGARVLEARLPSGEAATTTIRAAAGSEQSVSLAPERKQAAPVAVMPASGLSSDVVSETPPAPPASDSQSGSGVAPKTWVLLGGGAVTAALATAGIVQVVRGSNADDDVDSLRRRSNDEMGHNCPANSSDPTCQQLFSALDRRNGANKTVPYLFAGAGIAAAATAAIYYWMSTEEAPAHQGARVDLFLLPHAASLSFATPF
ncbi:MAG TPA: tetratricopeptide repeat protein [Polyangiaceae bacterium]|nr:tetratricopeptide repeat protein [Polyangiaceae bacterium]